MGGVLAYAYETETDLNAILAINIGVSAPLIIRAFSAANPFGKSSIDPGAGAGSIEEIVMVSKFAFWTKVSNIRYTKEQAK